MTANCWIYLLTAANSDRVIAGLVKGGIPTGLVSLLQNVDWPVAVLCLKITSPKQVDDLYKDVKAIVDGLDVKYYSIMAATDEARVNWSGPNISFSEIKKQTQIRAAKVSHLKIVPPVSETKPTPTV